MEKSSISISLSNILKDKDDQNPPAFLRLKSLSNSHNNNQQQNKDEDEINSYKKSMCFPQSLKTSVDKIINKQHESSNRDFVFSNLQKQEVNEEFSNINIVDKNLQSKKKDNLKHSNRKKKRQQIKNVISNQKVNLLKQYFIQKLKRNNQYASPIYHMFLEDQKNISFLDIKGIQIRQHIDITLNLIFFFNIIATIYIVSLSLVFQNVKNSSVYYLYKIINFFIFASQIILNFISVRFCLGRKLDTIKLISRDYIKNRFNVDLINILVVFCNIFTDEWSVNFMSMVILLKIPECMQKLQKLQVYFIENYYNEQYWQLIKVFIFNFCFAHILSILLIGMASLNHDNNWIKQKNLQNATWAQIYIWAYYWGTTLMLTIGFGDITPVSSEQAICMVFIQTISCIILAYNINCVGSLISNIRQQDLQKSKKLKIFRKLTKKNKMNEENSWKINNFIQQHSNMKKLFNIEEQKIFVDSLPVAYRTQYLKEANKTIFNQLFFLGSLMQNTLFSLAENIEMKVTHPEQIMLHKQVNLDLVILKTGEIGLMSQKKNRSYSQYIIDKVKIKLNQKPFLLNTNFITTQRSSYLVKSIIYSVMYILNRDKLISILRENSIDFEIYCMLKDKCKYKIDQFQVFVCEYCDTKHTKFDCPKLHYIPLHQHTINKFLHLQKISRNQRDHKFKRDKEQQQALINYSFYKEVYNCTSKKRQQKQLIQRKNLNVGVIKQLKTMICQDQCEIPPSQPSFKSHEIRGTHIYDNDEINEKQTILKVQRSIIQNTEQVMKYYLSKTINTSPCQDSIWTLDLDHMKNYKNYFCFDNPCNVDKKFDIDQRLKKIRQKSITSAIALILNGEQKQDNSQYHSNLIQKIRQRSYCRQKSVKYAAKSKYYYRNSNKQQNIWQQ